MPIKMTPVDGYSQWRGAYALDGSLNVTVTSGVTPVGLHAKDGSMNITVIPKNDGITRPLYARDGSMNVTLDPTYLSGPRLVEPQSATYVLGPLIDYNYAHNNITVTRAGALGNYFNSSGVLQTAVENTERLDNFGGSFKGLLVEPSLQNLAAYSNLFSDASWIKISGTITTGVDDGEGGTTAFTFTATGANGSVQRAPAVTIGVPLYSSFYIKRRTGTGDVFLRAGDTTSIGPVTVTNDWTRVEVTGTPTTTNGRIAVVLATSGDAVDIKYAQLALSPGSYIHNAYSVQNTRNSDRCEITGSAFSSFWNSSENTIYIEFEPRELLPATSRHIIDISDATANNRIQVYMTSAGNVVFQMSTGGVLQVSQTLGAAIAGVNKVAIRVKENNATGSLNGVTQATDTSCTVPVVDRMMIGANLSFTSTTILNGWIKKLLPIPRAISDLTSMTA